MERIIAPGATFTKTWRLKNVGTCTWTTSYSLLFDTGTQMGGPNSVNLPQSVAPGQTTDLTITLTAPSTAGYYRGYWKFKDNNGIPFGIGWAGTKSWWVDITRFGHCVTSLLRTPISPAHLYQLLEWCMTSRRMRVRPLGIQAQARFLAREPTAIRKDS